MIPWSPLARGVLADERGVKPARVALAWLQIELSEAEVQRLEEPYVPRPVLGHG